MPSSNTYLADHDYYRLIARLNPYDPGHDLYHAKRQEIVEALAEADIWPAYTRDEIEAPRYSRANYQPEARA